MTETYSITVNFPFGLNETQLKEIILSDLPTCTDVSRTDNLVNIFFTSQISPSEKVILDNIIFNYTYVAPLTTPNLYLANGIMKSDISNDTFTFLGNQPDEIHISKTSQTHYSSIKAAIAANNTANMIFIVHPGTYIEDNPLILPSGCCLIAAGNAENTTIVAQNSTLPNINLGVRCKFQGISLVGGSIGIYFDGTQSGGQARFSGVFETYIVGCNIGLEIDGKNFNYPIDTLYLREVLIVSTTYSLDKGIYCHSGGQIISSGVNIAGNPTFGINYGIYSEGSGSKISMTTSSIWFSGNGIFIDNSGEVEVQLLTSKYCNVALGIGPTGASKINGSLFNALSSISLDINVQSEDAIIDIQSGIIDILKIVNPNNVKINAKFQSTQYGAYYQNILGDIVFGTKRVPAKMAVGEGTYDVDGAFIFTNDNLEFGTWTDCTLAAFSIQVPPFNIFSGTTVDNCLYIGRDTNPTGIKIFVTAATPTLVSLSDLVWEYWNGTVWIEFKISQTNASPPYYSDGQNFISTVGKYQIRFGITSATPISFKTINGQNKKWIRIRLLNNISNIPVAEYCKLHVNSTEINHDGFIEYFGNARQVGQVNLFNTEGSDIFLKSNVVSKKIIDLPSGVLTRLGTNTYLPKNADIGFPLKIKLTFIGNTNSVGNVKLIINYGTSNITNTILLNEPGNIGSSNSIIIPINTAEKEYRETFSIDIHDVLTNPSDDESDLFWITIQRDGTDSNDTYSGIISIINVDTKYIKFCSDGHVLSF